MLKPLPHFPRALTVELYPKPCAPSPYTQTKNSEKGCSLGPGRSHSPSGGSSSNSVRAQGSGCQRQRQGQWQQQHIIPGCEPSAGARGLESSLWAQPPEEGILIG